MKNKFIIIITVLLVVIVGGTITAVAVTNSPKLVVARSLKKLSEDFTERSEIKPFQDIFNKGSLEFSLTSIKENNYDILKNSSLSGKIYFSQNAVMLNDANIKINGEKFSVDIYVSNEQAYVTEDKIIGGSYGIKYCDIADQLSNSIFSPDSKSDYAIDSKIFDKIISTLDKVEENDSTYATLIEILEKIFSDLSEIIFENADFSSEKTNVRINGTKSKVRLITITFDSDAIENIIRETYDYLSSDELISGFIENYDEILTLFANEITGSYYASFADIYKDALEEYENNIDDLCDNISENIDTISLCIATPKTSSKLLKLELKIDKETLFSLDCGKKGIEKSNEISLETPFFKASYKVNENNKKKTSVDINISDNDNQSFEISLEIDKEKNSYTASYINSYESYSSYYGSYVYTDKYTVKGSIETNGDKTSLTVDKITNKYSRDSGNNSYDYENEYVIKLDCKVVFDTKDKMPSLIKKYNTLSNITNKDIDNWLSKLKELDIY